MFQQPLGRWTAAAATTTETWSPRQQEEARQQQFEGLPPAVGTSSRRAAQAELLSGLPHQRQVSEPLQLQQAGGQQEELGGRASHTTTSAATTTTTATATDGGFTRKRNSRLRRDGNCVIRVKKHFEERKPWRNKKRDKCDPFYLSAVHAFILTVSPKCSML